MRDYPPRHRPGTSWPVLALVLLGTTANAADETTTRVLESVQAAISGHRCVSGRFEQTYLPNGFSTGRAQTGTLTFARPDRARFDYDEPAGRTFAIDADLATVVDPATETLTRRRLETAERSRYPLFELALGRLPRGFQVSTEPLDDGHRLTLIPTAAAADFAVASVVVRPDPTRVERIEWTDVDGNRNRFQLDRLRPRESCSDELFAPIIPAGYQLDQQEN